MSVHGSPRLGTIEPMTPAGQFSTGLVVALSLTLATSAALFFGSHAGEAFDSAFWPTIGMAAGIGVVLLAVRRTLSMGVGVVCGACASCSLQVAALLTMFVVGGGS